MTKLIVVDEDVIIVANDATLISSGHHPKASQADEICRLNTIKRLEYARNHEIICMDDADVILSRYLKHGSVKGQPGIAHAFLMHILNNLWTPTKVIRVALKQDEAGNFLTFPLAKALSNFDPADRIFVALAMAATPSAVILNAVDSDYAERKKDFADSGVRIEELCPHCLKAARKPVKEGRV